MYIKLKIRSSDLKVPPFDSNLNTGITFAVYDEHAEIWQVDLSCQQSNADN